MILRLLIAGFFLLPCAWGKSPRQVPKIPQDHILYRQAEKLVKKKKPTLSELEGMQSQLLQVPLSIEVNSLEDELKTLVYALEVRRFELLVSLKQTDLALAALSRALNELPTIRWPLYFSERSATALERACSKQLRPALCEYWLKRLSEVLPKNSKEFQPILTLVASLTLVTTSVTGERLSGTYTEKREKDDDALGLIVAAFTRKDYVETANLGQKFLLEFPKSSHQFRIRFLIAESLSRNNRGAEALPIFEEIIQKAPWSWYAVLAGRRLNKNLKDQLLQSPLAPYVGEDFGFSPWDELKVQRVHTLLKAKDLNGARLELEAMSRYRQYSDAGLVQILDLSKQVGFASVPLKILAELVQRQSPLVRVSDWAQVAFPKMYSKEIETAGNEKIVDPILTMSLIKQESAFYAQAVSASGALGLMQLMPVTALEMDGAIALADLHDPALNIRLGVGYLAQLLQRYEGSWPAALAAYNAGPTRVNRWRKDLPQGAGIHEFIESIPYRETRDYVTSILRNVYWYRLNLGLPPLDLEATYK